MNMNVVDVELFCSDLSHPFSYNLRLDTQTDFPNKTSTKNFYLKMTDTISSDFMGKFTGLIEKELIPKFSDIAVDVLLGLGDEPSSKESIVILLEDAFKKVLGAPNKGGSKKKASKSKNNPTEKKVRKSIPTSDNESHVVNSAINSIMPLIGNILERPTNEYVHHPMILGDNSKKTIRDSEIAFKKKQEFMKLGEIAETMIGNWPGWEHLRKSHPKGHPSGMDCRKKDNSIIMEVKNKWNTVKGSDIKKSLYPTLAKYKKENPKTRCIWAIVNPKPGCKKLSEKIKYDGVEIEKIQGMDLFKLVFSIGGNDYSSQIIDAVNCAIKHQ